MSLGLEENTKGLLTGLPKEVVGIARSLSYSAKCRASVPEGAVGVCGRLVIIDREIAGPRFKPENLY